MRWAYNAAVTLAAGDSMTVTSLASAISLGLIALEGSRVCHDPAPKDATLQHALRQDGVSM